LESCRIAIIGATGAVGVKFIELLDTREFPTSSIRVCASERSYGNKIWVRGEELTIEEPTAKLFSEVDIVFISANGDVSRELAPKAVRNGALVIDDSSAFRMNDNVPLVVPEVNIEDLESHDGIISIPNCSTTPLVMILKALNDVNPVKRVVVDTFQSVSGTGKAAVNELRRQSEQILNYDDIESFEYPHQIAFNVLPHIEPFLDNGYTREEMKMRDEARKILHLPDLAVSATCVRVPVMVSHSEAVHIEFTNAIDVETVRERLDHFPGILLLDDPASNLYPMPIEAEGLDEVLVGRIRKDISHPNGIAMWLSSDNLRKGAAVNALQIAEEILIRDLITN